MYSLASVGSMDPPGQILSPTLEPRSAGMVPLTDDGKCLSLCTPYSLRLRPGPSGRRGFSLSTILASNSNGRRRCLLCISCAAPGQFLRPPPLVSGQFRAISFEAHSRYTSRQLMRHRAGPSPSARRISQRDSVFRRPIVPRSFPALRPLPAIDRRKSSDGRLQ
jgi:hypothetical protein